MHGSAHSWHPLPPGRPHGAILKQQASALPIAAIVVGGLITALLAAAMTMAPPGLLLVAVPLLVGVLVLGVWFYTWLDRWEPEPPHFLFAAFLWGAGVSILVAGILNTIVLLSTESMFVTAVVAAPLTEESMKGIFLVLLLLGRRGRAEFNSRVDAIVYAGFIGMGFTFIEDMTYILEMGSVGEGIAVGIARTVSGTFLHAIFTTITALGIWRAVTSRAATGWLWAVAGWLGAVSLHALFNLVVGFPGWGFWAGTAISIGATLYIVQLGIASKRQEQAVLHHQLPVLVSHGWISGNEAGWLADKPARKQAIESAKRRGRQEAKLLADFIQNVTELCFIRDRLDARNPGPYPQEWIDNHAMLVGLVSLQRPVVDAVLGSGRWAPLPPQSGRGYGAGLPGRSGD